VLLCRKRARAQAAGIKVEAAAGSKPAPGCNTGGARKLEAERPINIKVSNQQGHELHFKLRRSTRLANVFDAYAQKMGLSGRILTFLFDGTRTNPAATAGDLGMEDGDCMDVTIEQYAD
jgi:small ubiquitin-related modifier